MEDLRERVIDDIRSCLISSKGGIPISQINRDYKMIVGQSIPFSKLGYSNLESFLKSVPRLNVCTKGGELFLEAMPTKNTAHITAMVRGQKSSGSRHKPMSSNFGPRQRYMRKPFLDSYVPARRVLLPTDVPKRPTPSPPRHLTSLSRANLPPRLKTHQSISSMEQIPSTQNFVGLRKGGDHRSFGDLDMSSYQEDPTHVHGDPIQPLSPLESNNPASSVLRTPTGVLGPSSIIGDYRMTSGSSVTSRVIPQLMTIPIQPQRNSAQARLLRPVQKTMDSDMKMAPSLRPPYETNPFFPKTMDTQSNKLPPPLLEDLRSPTDEQKNKICYQTILDEYCKVKQLPNPVYKIITSFPKSKAKQLVCSIKVGVDHGFSSYPTECKTKEEAIEVASQSALETLQKTFGALGESLPVTTNENLLIARVAEMLDEHPNGLWSLQVPADYRAIHKEILPEGWLDILRGSPLITFDRAAHNRFILLPNRSGSAKGRSTPSSTTSSGLMEDAVTKIDELSIRPESKASDIQQYTDESVTTLGQLNLPEDEIWNVYVSYATSTTNVWIRLIGEEYSALYDDMAADMELFYMNGGGKTAKDLVVGHYYALKVDDCWHRVELTDLTEEFAESGLVTKIATCFFVDNGDDEPLNASKLKVLEPSFTKLPCQAVQCRLTGLEDFSSDQCVESHLVDNIFGRNLVAKATVGESEEDGDSRPFPSLILYDTSTDENINLNDVLLEKILYDAIPPSLPKNGKILETYVSYISQSGSLYIQLPSSTFDYMIKIIEDYSSNIATDGEDGPGKITAGVSSVSSDVKYLARYDADLLWYRAVLDNKRPGIENGKVWVKFVDYGNSELTSFKDLVVLPSSNILSKLPFQAIECRLYNMPDDIQFTQKGLLRCREILPSEESVLLKVVPPTSDSATVKSKYEVDIFKRVQPDNLLASVSTTLSVEEGVFEKSNPDTNKLGGLDGTDRYGTNKSSFQKSANVPAEPGNMSRVLSAPKVPKVGELFDVHVTIAANPGNFTVQPWKDVSKFRSMMNAMQSVYSSASKIFSSLSLSPEEIEKYCQPLDKDQVTEGGVYAAQHDDQEWYRINVSKLIDEPFPGGGMVSAYFVDYGDVAVITLDKIRKLVPEFFNVPYQAIKAKLAGIAPVHSDWSVEDCLRFQEMVCNREFVAKIVETGPDLIDPSETVIGIHLTDTSDPDIDSSIGQILVDEGRAVAC